MRWEFDPGLSQVQWTVGYLGIAKVRGFFNKLQVDVTLDEDDPARSSVSALIDVRSIDSGVPDRDRHLLTDEYFDAERYPQIAFESTRVERDGDTWLAHGNLTMHGVTKPIVLRGTCGGDATDPRGNHRRGFSATATLNRGDFGIDRGSASQEVEIAIDVQLIRRD